jgi:hypothetical protein
LHRLFENYRDFNRSLISIIESYVQLWDKHTPHDKKNIKALPDTYPFLLLMDIILKDSPGAAKMSVELYPFGNMVR